MLGGEQNNAILRQRPRSRYKGIIRVKVPHVWVKRSTKPDRTKMLQACLDSDNKEEPQSKHQA